MCCVVCDVVLLRCCAVCRVVCNVVCCVVCGVWCVVVCGGGAVRCVLCVLCAMCCVVSNMQTNVYTIIFSPLKAFGVLKKCAAQYNVDEGRLDSEVKRYTVAL